MLGDRAVSSRAVRKIAKAPLAIAKAHRSVNNHWNPSDGGCDVGSCTPGMRRVGPPPSLGDWRPAAFSLATPPARLAGFDMKFDTNSEGNVAGDEAAAAPGDGWAVSLASRP